MATPSIQTAEESPVPVPALRSSAEIPPFPQELLESVSKLLPNYLSARRWFRAKARTIRDVQVTDVVSVSASSSLLVLRVAYADGPEDRYLLPITASAGLDDSVRSARATEALALVQTPSSEGVLLFSAFANPAFRSALLTAIAENRTFAGEYGSFSARRIVQTTPGEINPSVESAVSRAEQSNTSVIYGHEFILKLFRKIEEGINPDLEIGAFLTQAGFRNTPAVIGILEYKRDESSYAAGLLQRFVANQGDAWSYTLSALSGFLQRVLDAKERTLEIPAAHPLDLVRESVPKQAQTLIGPYLESARLLGRRTAEMHAALASGSDPAFQAEAFTQQDGEQLFAEMHAQADIAFNVLRANQSSITGDAAADARELLNREAEVRRRFEQLRDTPVSSHRIRLHGDYHLGQVLFTGDDFMIIDFEGEPARPLDERRHKGIAVRDVAGMVRSFQYAAYTPLFGQVADDRLGAAEPNQIAQWSSYWYAWTSRTYLQGYMEATGEGAFFPSSPAEQRVLLDAFLLHKALYEVAYELNNRPAWVRIPLRGILNLIA